MFVVLGILVFVHEAGTSSPQSCCGVRVEVFSLGFGPRLFGVKRGDTDYRVSLLPFGGYVKMAGEIPGEAQTGDPASQGSAALATHLDRARGPGRELRPGDRADDCLLHDAQRGRGLSVVASESGLRDISFAGFGGRLCSRRPDYQLRRHPESDVAANLGPDGARFGTSGSR